MRDWIAGAMTVLGTVLVLGGAVTIILRAWWRPDAAVGAPPPGDATAAPAPVSTPASSDPFATTLLAAPAAPPPAPAVSPPASVPATRPFGRLDAPERLIAWGVLLLVLAAVAAGAIGFDLGANAPVH